MPHLRMAYDLAECLNLQILTKLFLHIAFLFYSALLMAQLPNCNMYYFNYSLEDNELKMIESSYLSSFNANGYNNQPSFLNDDKIYFTTDYYSESTEIAMLDLGTKTLQRISYTPESEYSPTPVPGKDLISCVRVEMDGTSQVLMLYDQQEISIGRRLLNQTSNIGYHQWLNSNKLALFLLEGENEFYLAIADALTGQRKVILDKIGRTLKVKRDKLYFVHKINPDSWFVKSYDILNNKISSIIELPEEVEDFDFLDESTLICGKGSELMIYNLSNPSDNWQTVCKLDVYNIDDISRIACRNNAIILVDR